MDDLCGIDEAGRGPLAGPVAAAAVILPADFPVELLADSKRLTPARRDELEVLIVTRAVAWGIGWASHIEIDALNILRASHLAMRRALVATGYPVRRVVVDGSIMPDLGVPGSALVRADATVPAVMAASILAKTARDRWMVHYATIEPRYEFARHKGYPTPLHARLIREFGPSAIHRHSFRTPG